MFDQLPNNQGIHGGLGGVFPKVKPLGPKSDQDQFSHNNISGSSRIKVMRITKLITKGEMLKWSYTKISQLFLKEMSWFVYGPWGL